MAPKQQLDKSAWQWAETTDPESITPVHIHTAYRLGLRPCKQGTCRRNCKGNPHCVVGLGERDWLGEIDDSYWLDIEDPSLERRKPGEFVGLKNLGATCYVNTLLQLWFHNLTLRSAILRLEEPLDLSAKHEAGDATSAAHQEELLMPTTVCGHLQLIFGLLQHSTRRHVDPTPFINCLGLDAAQQQDAQEFSKLFMSLLEDTLQQQQDPEIRNLVHRQFTGKYNYVTVCSVCGGGSRCCSTFYELDLNIKGNKHLYECIDEFLKEEKLEGDNQYMCTVGCGRKQNAARRIQLQELPPVLNIQLLRFLFDRQSGTKKKLNTYIQFPEVLDLSQYVGQKEGSVMYDLYAVLIHRGPSAYSGHYVAHIRDQLTDSWYKFNDEEIEKMGSKSLSLGKEEEIEQTSKNGEKKPKTVKGMHASRNAYMLVYLRRPDDGHREVTAVPTLEDLPWRVRQCLQLDNKRLEDWTTDMDKMKKEKSTDCQERQDEVKHIYSMIPPTKLGDLEWIPTKWFTQWLGGDGKGAVPEVDTSHLLCHHSRMDPDKVNLAKCIDAKCGDLIYARFGGKQRLKGSLALCNQCVSEKCRAIRQRARIAEDSKLIGQLLKEQANHTSEPTGYWVGKSSLRSWKRLAMESMEEQQKSREKFNGNGDSPLKTECCQPEKDDDVIIISTSDTPAAEQSAPSTHTVTEGVDDESLGFNEDILCDEHGNLSIDESCRRLVPDDIWNRLKLYFPNVAEFPAQCDSCDKCKAERDRQEQLIATHKTIAGEQKSLLMDLYVGKNRPTWKTGVNQLWIITTEFVDE